MMELRVPENAKDEEQSGWRELAGAAELLPNALALTFARAGHGRTASKRVVLSHSPSSSSNIGEQAENSCGGAQWSSRCADRREQVLPKLRLKARALAHEPEVSPTLVPIEIARAEHTDDGRAKRGDQIDDRVQLGLAIDERCKRHDLAARMEYCPNANQRYQFRLTAAAAKIEKEYRAIDSELESSGDAVGKDGGGQQQHGTRRFDACSNRRSRGHGENTSAIAAITQPDFSFRSHHRLRDGSSRTSFRDPFPRLRKIGALDSASCRHSAPSQLWIVCPAHR